MIIHIFTCSFILEKKLKFHHGSLHPHPPHQLPCSQCRARVRNARTLNSLKWLFKCVVVCCCDNKTACFQCFPHVTFHMTYLPKSQNSKSCFFLILGTGSVWWGWRGWRGWGRWSRWWWWWGRWKSSLLGPIWNNLLRLWCWRWWGW